MIDPENDGGASIESAQNWLRRRTAGAFASAEFRRAALFAAEKHSGQLRKDRATPYIIHPLSVAAILHDEAGIVDLITLQSAVLHDTIEDTDVTYRELLDAFGEPVADTVLELTNEPGLPSDRKTAAQVATTRTLSARAAYVRMADKIANLRDIVSIPPVTWTVERKRKYYADAREVMMAMPVRHSILEALFSEAFEAGLDLIRRSSLSARS